MPQIAFARMACRFAVACGLMAGLGACALPITIATLATDGVLYAATGKTSTDHGLSVVMGQDCATLRVFDGSDICTDNQVAVVAAPEREPDDVARGRSELARLPQSPDRATRMARADDALSVAFQPYAGGGRVVVASAPIQAPVQFAALPRPVAPGAVMVASVSQIKPSGTKAPKTALHKHRIKVASDLPIRRAVDQVVVRKLAEVKGRRKLSMAVAPGEQVVLLN